MIRTLKKLPFFELLKGPSLLIEGLWDTPKALLIQHLAKRPILVVTSGESESRLVGDLETLKIPAIEFPAWETLPGEEITPSLDIVGRRLEILSNLRGSPVILTPLQNILQKVPSREELSGKIATWRVGEEHGFDLMGEHLTSLGYRREKVCSDKGQFAIRGGIVDIFPIASPHPFRVEFFGDEIEQIRLFDPMSQKSVDRVEEFFLTPGDESALKCEAHLLDYLKDPLIIFDDLLAIEDKWTALKGMPGFNSPLLSDLNLDVSCDRIFLSKDPITLMDESATGRESVDFELCGQKLHAERVRHPFQQVTDYFDINPPSLEALKVDLAKSISQAATTPMELYFYGSTRKELTKLKSFAPRTPEETKYVHGYLSSGFVAGNLVVISDTMLTGRFKLQRKKWRSTYHTPVSEFHELSVGDLVVHFHNGVGKYLGIEKQKNHLGLEEEFMIVEYAGNAKLFVPLSQAHLVSRYIGSHEERPQLHQIGSNKWARAKVTAQQSIIGYAKEMLQLQAEREAHGGLKCSEDSDDMLLFEDEFPYTETEDQLKAIADIKADMQSDKAMDRLICGDVGYGKTEVAMRAAFKAVVDGGAQVAVLVPTTVLAVQHYENFRDRMSNFPVTVGVISRFQKPKEIRATLEKVSKGQIDILVGTHRIVSKDVSFKNLGLIVIDEEQRFGVRVKEKLKKFKVGVDCLTMSATPIPRTLYMSLISAREMSVINSPPQDRLPIKTIIAEREDELVKNALMRELARDGQAYFVHNRVESIHEVSEHIQKLIPTARTGVMHGQMDSDLADQILHKFKSGELDVLVATTIVENGIDIPNANTILIDRSHQFGVADLYQLRGRVGRWNKSAYAYFLTPENRQLPEISQKRLQALVEASGYGGGMKLAMRDLEIRGAGDILGVKQSGHVSTVGFHLYCKLLKKAIEAIKSKKPASFLETKIECKYDAQIPPHYIDDTSLRLEIYHRLGDASSLNEVDGLLQELEDRFGKPPKPVMWLYHLSRLRVWASEQQIVQIKIDPLQIKVQKRTRKGVVSHSYLIPPLLAPQELELMVRKRIEDG